MSKLFFKKNDSLKTLKNHLDSMKKELDKINSQIELLKTNKNLSEWDKLEFVYGKSIDDLHLQKRQISKEVTKTENKIKRSRSKTLLITELALLPILFLLIVATGIDNVFIDSYFQSNDSFKTIHLIENLRGDTVDTWKSWRLVGTTMNVNILNPKSFPDERVDVIKNAITSDNMLELDDSITHKGPEGSISTYFEGWEGALKYAANQSTKYNLPTNFNIIESQGGEGDIIITLSNLRDTDGYTGYTKSVIDGNEILKSFITIYDVSNLTDEQLSTIVRHEFGHALGLGHSTAPEDLMAPTIDMTVPYISECNVAAVVDLYNGIEGSTVCEK